MGCKQLKICRLAMAACMAVALAASLQGDASDAAMRSIERVEAPAHAAGFGGVLVTKRMKMILGFVQTLPA